VELARARTPLGIITRGPLIVRDRDVLQDAARRGGVKIHVSIGTLDDAVWSATEPATAHPRQRLRAVRMLVDAGLDAGVGIAPVLPGVTSRADQLEAIVRAARDAGATRVWASLLHLQAGVREHFMGVLARHWPEERQRYERLYAAGPYLRRKDAEQVLADVARLKQLTGVADRRLVKLAPPPEPVQLDLAV
jgi:DNA repair photolyase